MSYSSKAEKDLKKMIQNSSINKVRLIKKYGNRRLYDTYQSSYISFKELGDIISNGFEICVIDSSTNEDLTRQTIANYLLDNTIILNFCSNDLLKTIIKIQGYSEQQKEFVANIFERYFKYPPYDR